MARPLYDSEFIFGIHEPGGENEMIAAGRPGWIVFTEGIGSEPNDHGGRDYTGYSSRDLGIIVRLNNGYHPAGTIPYSNRYADFAQRCANFAAASRGCKTWIIGNEMNYAIERPQDGGFVPSAAPILPDNVMEDAVSAAEVEDVTVEVPSDLADRPGCLIGWWNRFLHTISGGMGDAELGHPSAGAMPVPPPPSPPLAAPEDPLLDADPYHHGDPARFSALLPVEESDEAIAADAPASDTGPWGTQPLAPAAAPTVEQVITPQLYAQCYRLCRDAIHRVPGHENDLVLVGAVAPWNNQTSYPGNPAGDWVQYFRDTLLELGPGGCDGITLHTYTHQADPNLIHSDAKMGAPFQHLHYEFRAYRDFMAAVPANMRHLPAFITETDEDVAWLNQNIGWVQQAYGEIDWWNRQPGHQQIRALILYRWPRIDKWYIEGKQGVIEDFRQALQHDYRWQQVAVPPPTFKAGDVVETLDIVNLRRTPGYQNQPSNDVLAELPQGTRVTIERGTQQRADGLTWWQVSYGNVIGAVSGWLADSSPSGIALLRKAEEDPKPPGEEDRVAVGGQVLTLDVVRMRRAPGYQDKPAGDVIADIPADTTGSVVSGPTAADDLTWWEVLLVDGDQQARQGWIAEIAPNGIRLLAPAGQIVPPAQGSNTFAIDDPMVTLDVVRLRTRPGYQNKPADDVVADLPAGTVGTVNGGPRGADELTWWQVATTAPDGRAVSGWAAEVAPNGVQLLAHAGSGTVGQFTVGELVQAATHIRVRRSPGNVDKPDGDVLGGIEGGATLNIVGGPRTADELTWWQVGGISLVSAELVGWVAEIAPNGVVLMQRPPQLPGTDIPDRARGRFLGAPFHERTGIAQLWGENPQVYSRFSYDGVALKGHNGIDFLTVTGTDLLAVDDGIVAEAIFNDPSGFGHYVKLEHRWGESIYAHMLDIAVQPGQPVRRGQLLGQSDNTGFSGGPHLHFSIRVAPYDRTDGWGGFTDPLPYLDPASYQLPAYVLPPLPGGAAAAALPAEPIGPGMAPDRPDVKRP